MPPERRKMHFEGSAYFEQKPAYAPALKPIVLLKKLFSALYNLLLQVVWSELVEGKQTDSGATAVLFLLLCVLSLIFYQFGDYQQPITIAFLLIWTIDRQIALHQFYIAAARSTIHLHGGEDWLVWDQQFPDGQHNHLKLNQTQIEQITVHRIAVRGGVFDDQLGLVWQVCLRLCDGTELLVDEQQQANTAFQVARSLAKRFNLPLTFQHSEGQGKFAAEPISGEAMPEGIAPQISAQISATLKTFPRTIQVQKNSQQWQICSRWRWTSGWLLIKQIVQKTGFLLFVLWMSNFLVRWGEFLHVLLIAPQGDSVFDLFSLLLPHWEWTNVLELGFALIVLLIQGAKLSFEEHLLLNRSSLSFYRNTKRLAQIPLAAIAATLFVKQPDPVLLILTPDRVVEVDGFQQDVEFRAVLLTLDQAIAELQSELQPELQSELQPED